MSSMFYEHMGSKKDKLRRRNGRMKRILPTKKKKNEKKLKLKKKRVTEEKKMN